MRLLAPLAAESSSGWLGSIARLSVTGSVSSASLPLSEAGEGGRIIGGVNGHADKRRIGKEGEVGDDVDDDKKK